MPLGTAQLRRYLVLAWRLLALQVASKLCGAEGHHSCSPGPSVVVSGGRFVWCCEVGWGLCLPAAGGSQSGEGMSSAGKGRA